jgi:salicylate hydroxylase
MKIIVVGGGIGGLTAAGLLERAGHDVVMLEKAATLGSIGAGIQISPNAARIITKLGLTDGLATIGTRPERVVTRRWEDDRMLAEATLGHAVVERFGEPYFNVFRPDLIDLLAGALDRTEVRLGCGVVRAHTDGDRARVETADGTVLDVDLVVAADGIHSAVRTSVFGSRPSRFSGSVAYRALLPRSAVKDFPVEVTNRQGPGRHVVSYFVGRDRAHFNLVCVVPDHTWDVESWTEPGSVDDLRAQFAGWSSPLQELLGLVRGPVFRWALHDREPLASWTSGRVTLLGDACHPMLPFMAQGACQAIEDAAVLTRCLHEGVDIEMALRRYEATRIPRTSVLQHGSFANATSFHLPDGPEQQQRDERYAEGTGIASLATDWLYGYNALTAPLTSVG